MKEITLLSITSVELKEIIKEAIEEKLNFSPNAEPERFLDIDETSIYIKTSKSSIYKLTMERKIPFYKPSKRVLFKKSELDDWISKHRIMSYDEIEREADNYLLKNKR